MKHSHASYADIDSAYVGAMRAAARGEGRKRRPKLKEVRILVAPGCRVCAIRIAALMPGLHRLHGAER